MAARLGNAPFNSEVMSPAGSDQGSATLIRQRFSPGLIMAAGDAVTGLRLPAASKGKIFYIKNTGTNQLAILYVYPAVGNAVNSLAVNSPIQLGPQTSATFIAGDSTTWHTIPVVPS